MKKKSPVKNYKKGYYKKSPAKGKGGQQVTITNAPSSVKNPTAPRVAYRVPSEIRAAKLNPRGEAGSMGYHVSEKPSGYQNVVNYGSGVDPDPLYMDWATGDIHTSDPRTTLDEFGNPISKKSKKSSSFKMKGWSGYTKKSPSKYADPSGVSAESIGGSKHMGTSQTNIDQIQATQAYHSTKNLPKPPNPPSYIDKHKELYVDKIKSQAENPKLPEGKTQADVKKERYMEVLAKHHGKSYQATTLDEFGNPITKKSSGFKMKGPSLYGKRKK